MRNHRQARLEALGWKEKRRRRERVYRDPRTDGGTLNRETSVWRGESPRGIPKPSERVSVSGVEERGFAGGESGESQDFRAHPRRSDVRLKSRMSSEEDGKAL